MIINLNFVLLHTTSDNQLSLNFFFIIIHMVFNNSSLFMSMSNLIKIYIHFMDMKLYMLIYFFISMLVDKGKIMT
jgi:hypothetical protein